MKQKTVILLLCSMLTVTGIFAQYEISEPSLSKREAYDLQLRTIRIFPEKILLNFEWVNNGKDRSVRASYETRFQIPDLSSDQYPIADRINITPVSSRIPDREYFKFGLAFNVSLFKLIEKQINSHSLSGRFLIDGVMLVDYYDCTDAFRSANNIRYGNCWNMYGIFSKLPLYKWNAIYSYGKLESSLQKDEFETSQQYKTRTSAAGLQDVFEESVDDFMDICERAFQLRMAGSIPELEYNADEQVFKLTYPGAVTARIKVPVDKARDFKADILSGNLKPTFAYVKINSSGKYVIHNINFEQGKSSTTYENLLSSESSIDQLETDYKNKVLSELKWLQTQNGAKAVIK